MKRDRLRYLKTLLTLSLRELLSLRFSTILQAGFMLLNNLLFFLFWVLLYRHLDSIRGIELSHIALLYGIACTSFGMAVFFFGGAFQMADLISKGVLDVYLTQPRNAHMQLMTSKTYVFGAGDFLSGALLIACFFGTDVTTWLYWAMGSFLATVITVSTMSLVHSIIFFIPRTSELSNQLFEFFLGLSLYPANIFPTPLRVFMLSILPASYVAFIPMLAYRDAKPELLFLSVVAAFAYARLAGMVFRSGVRKYTSGSLAVQIR